MPNNELNQVNLVQDHEVGSYSIQANGVDGQTARNMIGTAPIPVKLEIIDEGQGKRRIIYAGPSDGLSEAMIHVRRLDGEDKKFKLPCFENLIVIAGVSLLGFFLAYWVVSSVASLQQPSYSQYQTQNR